jgi:hypothetical protein
MRRILAISSIGNQPHNLHGKYIPGAGVGASSVATRRLKLQRSAGCYPPTVIIGLRVSDIATYDDFYGHWTLNHNTVINVLQYLTINNNEELHIPYDMTFTNNGQVDNYGAFETETNGFIGSTIYNTGAFRNYGNLEVKLDCEFYTYGGGSVYNSTSEAPYPQANIVLEGTNVEGAVAGIFALPPLSGSTCGSGTFTGKAITIGSITYTCPP